MALIRTLEGSQQQLEAEVCLVGAGAAGLVAATRIAGQSAGQVIVLESGLTGPDEFISALDQLINPAANYGGSGRERGLGGTSQLWAGKLLPLSAHDMVERPHLGLDAWPIEPSAIARYFPEIEKLLGVECGSYEEDATPQLDGARLLPRCDPYVSLRWPKIPAQANRNVAYALRRMISSQKNLAIWLNSTAATLHASGNRLDHVTAVNRQGGKLTVRAKHFVIAAGTLETTRLLLMADRQNEGIISKSTNALGRYFNDHLSLEVAELRPRRPTLTNRALGDRWPKGSRRHLHGELRREVQESARIGSAYFDIGVEIPAESALTQTRLALDELKHGRIVPGLRRLVKTGADMPNLVRTAEWRYLRRFKYWPVDSSAKVKIWIEQLPQWNNRILLSQCNDYLDQPILRIEYRRSAEEDRTFAEAIQQLGRFWSSHLESICYLHWFCPGSRSGWAEKAAETSHPAGTTRMGCNPATSVVDPNLRIHRLANVSIASASTFPSSGSANPTLTILALAMLAGDDIVRSARLN